MATTSKGIFYPLGTDAVNIAGNLQTLAESVDTELNEYGTLSQVSSASANAATVALGYANSASANAATVALGYANSASANAATVALGYANSASANAVIVAVANASSDAIAFAVGLG